MMKSETPFYTDIADYYDAIFPLNEAAVRWTERHLKDQHKTDLLDIGCGTGSLALALAGKFGSAAGIDLDARMIEKARKKAAASGSSAVFHVLDMLDCAKKFTNERYQYPRASGLPTVSLGPEALRASVPPHGAGYLNLAIPALARKWNQQVGSAPLASFGNQQDNHQNVTPL
jgi:SAM-dependent methyltransferase